jgi:hypothetical protein
MEKLYQEHQGIIKAMSRKISKTTGFPDDDIESEGNLIFVECARKYNPEIGPFSKYLINALHWSLYEYAINRVRQLEELQENPTVQSVSHNSEMIDVSYENLSREARTVVDIVLHPDEDLLGVSPTAAVKKSIEKALIYRKLKRMGWRHTVINHVFNEISLSL